jgi:hypothetical protein
MLGNTIGDTWSVRLVKWRNHIFIEHGWDAFAEANNIAEGDTLFLVLTYT